MDVARFKRSLKLNKDLPKGDLKLSQKHPKTTEVHRPRRARRSSAK
jgi:hypothetical protein